MIIQLDFIKSFVEDMLNLQMLTSGVLTIHEEYFNPISVIDFVINMMKIKSDMQNIKIFKQVNVVPAADNQDSNGHEFPLLLLGDERRFKQVLINLVKNALKFTKKGFIRIFASYQPEKSELTVSVKDTGAGIA